MDTAQAVQNLDNLMERVLAWKQGKGERPSNEELKDGLKKLRESRATAQTNAKSSKSGKKAPSKEAIDNALANF